MASDDARGRPAQAPPIEKIAQEAIEEARMVLHRNPGALRFSAHGDIQRQIQNAIRVRSTDPFRGDAFISLSIALIMTPAAYHRQVEPGSVSKFFVGLASLLVALAMIPLMTGLSLEVYLVGQIILQVTSAIIATALFGIFAGLWYGFPFAMKRRLREKP